MIPVFRKYHLHKTALTVVLAVVESLLGPQPVSCGLSWNFSNLAVEELHFVANTVKALLSDFSEYVVVVVDSYEISVNLVVFQDSRQDKTLIPGTSG